MADALILVADEVSGHLAAIAALFSGTPKVTLFVRHPALEAIGADADFIMTDDDLDEVARMVERRTAAARTSSGGEPEAAPLTDPDAPAVSPADVSAPRGRPVETSARGQKPEQANP